MDQTPIQVLLIDDDHSVNVLHKKIISELHPRASIISYTDPANALVYLNNAMQQDKIAPDYIFLDVNMPRMSGWEYIEAISQFPRFFFKNTAIYMVSSIPYPGNQLRINAEPLVKDWIEKPLSKEVFLDVLNYS